MIRSCFFLLALAVSLRAEVIDRIAISIGYWPITELQIDEELRIAALLNHKPVLRDRNSRHNAAGQLIQQFLIERDMQVSRYPTPTAEEVDAYLQQVENDFGGSSQLEAALTVDELDKPTLLRHLAIQLAILRFVDVRFRPEFSVSDADVQAYIKRERSEAKTLGEPPSPPPDADSIRRQLIEKRTDDALAVWLVEVRKQFNIVYLDKSLQ